MTSGSFLGGISPLSDGSMVVSGQNTGRLRLGRGQDAVTIVGGSGHQGRRPWLARFGLEGDLIWAKPIAGNYIGFVSITPDDSIIVSGSIHPHEDMGNDPDISRVFGRGTAKETRVPGCTPLVDLFHRLRPGKQWAPIRHEPTCEIWFVARYNRDGEFQWVRTAHSQDGQFWALAIAQPDNSVVVRVPFHGVALLDAGTPMQRHIELPRMREVERPVPYLVHYLTDGSLASVRQLSPPNELLEVWPFPLGDGSIALLGWRGFHLGTTDRDQHRRFPPNVTVLVVNARGDVLWEVQLGVVAESFDGGHVKLDRFPNGDLLVTFSYAFRGRTQLTHHGEVLYEAHADYPGEKYAAEKIYFALRVTSSGRIRWLIPTAQGKRSRFLGSPSALAMDDGSWLLAGTTKEGDGVYEVAPGQRGARRLQGQETFVARFFPDGRLDGFLEPPEMRGWWPSSRERLPDGTFLSLIEDWTVTRGVPTPVIARVRLGFDYAGSEEPSE